MMIMMIVTIDRSDSF